MYYAGSAKCVSPYTGPKLKKSSAICDHPAQERQARILKGAGLAGFAAFTQCTNMQTQTNIAEQKAVSIFAKSIYRELKAGGYSGEDVMQLAGELLSLLTRDVQSSGPRPAAG